MGNVFSEMAIHGKCISEMAIHGKCFSEMAIRGKSFQLQWLLMGEILLQECKSTPMG